MALSRFQCLLKKSRPLSRSAQRRNLTLEALKDRTVLSFLPASTFSVGDLPRAITVADFNNDGQPDLAVVNQGPVSSSTLQGSLSVLLGKRAPTAKWTSLPRGPIGDSLRDSFSAFASRLFA
jgi:hypothetical protein